MPSLCLDISKIADIWDLKQQLGELPTDRSTGKDSKICGAIAERAVGISHDSNVTITSPIELSIS
ncbi:hypothetical protein [Microseira wollei]|uniref:hypothetical protein n=1 Tax=Microseira wollei TaxID=467598 RepID=UPI001CFE8A52|nr:hypothetical protein [Microseira wollei]